MSEKDEEEKEEDQLLSKYKNITEERLEEIDEYFGIFDRDGDSQLNMGEFTSLLRWLGYNPTDGDMKRYFSVYDTMSTGYVDKKIVYTIVNEKEEEPDTMEELIEAIKLLDPHGEGMIPVPELRWAMTQLGDPMEETLVDDMIKEVESDENKGYVNITDFAFATLNIKKPK